MRQLRKSKKRVGVNPWPMASRQERILLDTLSAIETIRLWADKWPHIEPPLYRYSVRARNEAARQVQFEDKVALIARRVINSTNCFTA